MKNSLKYYFKIEYENGKEYLAESYAYCDDCGKKYIDIATHSIHCKSNKTHTN